MCVCVFVHNEEATFFGYSHELPAVGLDLLMNAYLIVINQSALPWIANEIQKVLLFRSYLTILKRL